MSERQTFGGWLRQQRHARDVTQDDVAEHLGFSAALLRKLEAGERRPSGQIAELLADYFRIPADERVAFVAFARTGQAAEGTSAPPANTGPPHAPWRSVYLRQNHLPALLAPLIGREREGAAAHDQLRHPKTRLLTLTGTAGIGKTRLGLHVAAALVDHFADGVFFVDLAPVSDPALVLPTVAQTLGLTEAGDRSIERVLLDYVGGRRLLLLLDNFEQVLDAAPAVVRLLEASPWLKVLVTSREALHVRGERRFPVLPLGLPDPQQVPTLARLTDYPAVALFVERAQAVDPAFALTAENAADVVAVCSGLAGVPLAIELAAARIRHLAPPAMRAALSSRLQLVTGGARDLPARHQTLRSAIAWSYDLLAGHEQRLFRALGVFVGGCTSDALDELGVGPPNAPLASLDTLRSLTDKHLIQADPPSASPPTVRFGLLEAVREYALEQVAQHGETAELRRRHAAYYLALAEQAEQHFTGPQHPGWGAEENSWIDRLERDLDNLRAGLDWYQAQTAAAKGTAPARDLDSLEQGLRLAVALRRVWFGRGYFTEGRQRLQALLALVPQPLPTESRPLRAAYAAALVVLGRLAPLQGDPDAVQPLLAASLSIARELHDPQREAGALLTLGAVALAQRDYRAARAYQTECLALYRALGNKWGAAAALEDLGEIEFNSGEIELARVMLAESLALYRAIGDDYGTTAVLGSLGRLAYAQGDYAAAHAWWRESLQLGQAIGYRSKVGHTLVLLGWAALRQGKHEEAHALFRDGLLWARELGAMLTLHWCLVGWAALAGAQQQPVRAARLFGAGAALQVARAIALAPANQAELAAEFAAARRQLPDAAWDVAWQDGHTMALAAAVTVALDHGRVKS